MTYSRASEFFKKELVKVLMLKITDFTVYDLVVLQLQLLWVFQTACYRGKEGGVLRRQRTITLMSQKTLYFILQK